MVFTVLSEVGENQLVAFMYVFFIGSLAFIFSVFIFLFFNFFIMKRLKGNEDIHPKKTILKLFSILSLIGWAIVYWRYSQLNEFILYDTRVAVFYGLLFILTPSVALILSAMAYCIYVHIFIKRVETPDDFFQN